MRFTIFTPTFLKCLLSFVFAAMISSAVNAQISYDRIVQINGVTMTSDSLMGISDVTISVKNQNRGTYSSPLGVFSLVCFKGDTLNFSALGFRSKQVVIPVDVVGNSMSMVQLMSQDTFFLDETIIHMLPSKENFNYAFQHWQVPDDKYEVARRNTNLATLRMIALTMGHDGRENQHIVQNNQAYQAAYYGQQQPMNIFSPLKWAEFFQAWKRGDYRKKKDSSSY
jgi:hypothetical protein